TQHFPSSFYPRSAFPKRLIVEGRIPPEVRDELVRRGHEVVVTGDWANGRVLGIRFDRARGLIFGGASPRNETGYAVGWQVSNKRRRPRRRPRPREWPDELPRTGTPTSSTPMGTGIPPPLP